MKRLLSYARVINTNGDDKDLFTCGTQGIIFLAINVTGLTFKLSLSSGGVIPFSEDSIGSGMSFGDTLIANGDGYVHISMWGELQEYYRIVNLDNLEVIVGSPIPVDSIGQIGNITSDLSKPIWVPANIYTDNKYSIDNFGVVTWQ